MKNLIVPALVLLSLSFSIRSEACSYSIDEKAKTKELKSVALANLNGAKVLTAKVTAFSYFESKPTPMCPEELTYKALVTAEYKSGLNYCVVELSVEKIEPWDKSDLDTYKVTGRKSARCSK